MANFAYSPQNVTVSAGTTVIWTSLDDDPHTVTHGAPTAPGNAFASALLNNGESFPFRFAAPGSFPYFCAIHVDMRGTITVTP